MTTRSLRSIAVLSWAAFLALGLPGCPKCADFPIVIALQSAFDEPTQREAVVEWSFEGGPFEPCEGFNGDRHHCGPKLLWGLCGPDEDEYVGTYQIRVTQGEDVVEERIEVGSASCNGPETTFITAPGP